jgi:hypothetical protein
MLEKCAACGGRILAGGDHFLDHRFCNEDCSTHFKVALVDETLSSEDVSEQVAKIFDSPCPQCGDTTGNDLYSATRITGMLLAYQVQSGAVLCCSACGRKNRLTAALHCFFLGWWSIRAAFFNVFVLPTNLLCALFVRQPTEPSPALATFVKVKMADAMQSELAVTSAARDRQPE